MKWYIGAKGTYDWREFDNILEIKPFKSERACREMCNAFEPYCNDCVLYPVPETDVTIYKTIWEK